MTTERFIDIKVRTGSAEADIDKLDDKMEDLSQSTDKAAASTAKLTKTAKGVKTGIAGVGRSAGQAGIQLQQFIGQVQGGQNAMLAFSQQSADLGFVLGAPLLGAIAGISASIAGILLPELFKADEAVDELTEKMKEWKKTIGLTREQADFLINKEIEANTIRAKSIAERTKEINIIETAIDNQKVALENFDLEDKARNKLLKAQRESLAELAEANALRQSETQLVVESGKQIDIYNKSVGQGTDALEKQKEATDKQIESTERLNEKQSAQASGFSRKLSAETDLIREEIAIREMLASEAITRQEAQEEIRFARILFRETERFSSQIAMLGDNQAAIEEATLAFNEKIEAATLLHEQNLTNITATAIDERVDLSKDAAEAENSLRSSVISNAIGLFQVLGKESKAAALVGIAIAKAQALSANAVATASGSTLAFAAQQVPGDPSSFARGTAAAAKVKTLGSLNAALIAATGLAQGASVSNGGSGSLGANESGGSFGGASEAPQVTQEERQQTRVVDIRTDGSAFSEAVKDAALVLFNGGDEDVVVNITNAQSELVRTGVL